MQVLGNSLTARQAWVFARLPPVERQRSARVVASARAPVDPPEPPTPKLQPAVREKHPMFWQAQTLTEWLPLGEQAHAPTEHMSG